jgi:hypothetical protein
VPTKVDSARFPFEIVLIRQEVRSGIIGGLNAGLDYIRSQGFTLMARLDAGDLHRPNRLAIQYQHLKKSEELAMVGCNVLFRSEESGDAQFMTDLPLVSGEIRKWMVCRTCFIHPAVMIRLDRVDDSLRYESRYLHIEDYVLFTKIAERYETENLREPLVECLLREGGISRSNDRAQLLSGIRHHLANPKPFNGLWYVYLLKRSVYLVMPFGLRMRIKNWFGFIKPTMTGLAAQAKMLEQMSTPCSKEGEFSQGREPAHSTTIANTE